MELKTIRFPIVLSSGDDDEEPQETATHPQQGTNIHSLSKPILQEIQYRVPPPTLLYCKTLLEHYPIIHFPRAPICPLLVFTDESGHKPTKITHLVKGQTASDLDPRIGHKRSKAVALTDHVAACSGPPCRFLPLNANAVSCEGMLCWASNGCTPCGASHISICNPVTGECFTLHLSPNEEDNDCVFIGIGFRGACKKFEILRMSRKRVIGNEAEVSAEWWPEVLTVAFESRWRRVGVSTPRFDFAREITEVVYVNGAIYWRYIGDSSIFSFHFERTLFQMLHLPQMDLFGLETINSTFVPKDMISLGVLGNFLCVSMISPYDGRVELWVFMEIYGDGQARWDKLCDVETATTRLEHSGTLGSRGRYKAIKYLERGGILMHDWRETFLAYDPVTKTERIFRVLEHSSARSCLPLQKSLQNSVFSSFHRLKANLEQERGCLTLLGMWIAIVEGRMFFALRGRKITQEEGSILALSMIAGDVDFSVGKTTRYVVGLGQSSWIAQEDQ